MACCLVALNKRPGVHPVEIGETFRRDISKLVMRAEEDQANTACGSLQLCAGIEARIEGGTHAVVQRRRDRHVLELGGGSDEGSEGVEDESTAATSGTERAGEAAILGGRGEVLQPHGERN